MVKFIVFVTALMNDFHDWILSFFPKGRFQFIDELLHFVIIAAVGMIIFACVYALFKFLSKYGIAAISFVYTFTVVAILAFAIEIQQGVTKRGDPSLSDILWGLGGFLCIFSVYLIIKKIRARIKRKYEKSSNNIVEDNMTT